MLPHAAAWLRPLHLLVVSEPQAGQNLPGVQGHQRACFISNASPSQGSSSKVAHTVDGIPSVCQTCCRRCRRCRTRNPARYAPSHSQGYQRWSRRAAQLDMISRPRPMPSPVSQRRGSPWLWRRLLADLLNQPGLRLYAARYLWSRKRAKPQQRGFGPHELSLSRCAVFRSHLPWTRHKPGAHSLSHQNLSASDLL